MTTPRSVEVRAPSRLHFGLFSFNSPGLPLQHGGVGAMVDAPGLVLNARWDNGIKVEGRHAVRATEIAGRVLAHLDARPHACRLEIRRSARRHVGLGLGTQLGMSIAAALFALSGREHSSAEELAAASGRGLRSAIGAHGFLSGGLLIDGGHQDPDALGELSERVSLPADWRFVLVTPPDETGLANEAERQAFAALPAPPRATTARLHQLACEGLVPAARQRDYQRFADCLYKYGRLAGECFAAVQGGPFASPQIAQRVELMRSLGHPGCGQSSWGPTVYALAPDEPSAMGLADRLGEEPAVRGCEVVIAAPCNTGATVTPLYSSP